MDRRMWVFILLLLVGSTIIVTRVFRNAAQDEVTEPPELGDLGARRSAAATGARSAATAHRPSGPSARPSAPSPPAAYPPAVTENAGGACPSCGTEVVPGAKFCGECGQRLAT